MSLPLAMPGTFPAANSASRDHNPTSREPLLSPTAEISPPELFEQRELVGTKTHAQRHLIGQLNSLAYFLMGYQFVRFCYLSCLPPLFLHVVVQRLLDVEDITDNTRPTRVLFGEAISLMERQAEAQNTTFRRSVWVSLLLAKLGLFVYWKFVVAAVWHILFVVLMMQQIATAGHIDNVSLGLWYCLSFIGENLPSNYSVLDPWWVLLWKLGLVELVVTDVAILALQLCLFQSIFLQSTISPKGIALGEEEVYILRNLSGGARGVVPVDEQGRPEVLHIRLFQMFEGGSFSQT